MTHYILDTNFFFNLEIKSGLGDNPQEIIEAITEYAVQLKKNNKAVFYLAPSIMDEMLTFVDKDEPYMKAFLSAVTIKAPEKSKVTTPTSVMYDYVQENRERAYRGLQVAEEELLRAAKDMMGVSELNKIEFQKRSGEYISKLRERFRNATRTKFLDSTADLDIIILARELNGNIITSDEGVILWARKYGVKETLPQVLKNQLEDLLSV